jgi:hypothetical protein
MANSVMAISGLAFSAMVHSSVANSGSGAQNGGVCAQEFLQFFVMEYQYEP